jgi:SAM-dependent methyltransferase
MRQGHLLRFTSPLGATEFAERCSRHDFWYHSYYFENGLSIRGDYDIGLDVQNYRFPADLKGLKVLDIGTGSGWFATYFEQQGAQVTTVDARGYSDFDVWARPDYPDIAQEKPQPDRIEAGRPVYYSPVSRGFWIMKEILGLEARYVNARIYDIRPELFGGENFDLVFLGSVLMHVRDPIGALMAARRVCRGTLIANSLCVAPHLDTETPLMEFLNNPRDQINWWRPNRQCLEQAVAAAGFRDIDTSHRVQITADSVYADSTGRSSGATQSLYLVHARV